MTEMNPAVGQKFLRYKRNPSRQSKGGQKNSYDITGVLIAKYRARQKILLSVK